MPRNNRISSGIHGEGASVPGYPFHVFKAFLMFLLQSCRQCFSILPSPVSGAAFPYPIPMSPHHVFDQRRRVQLTIVIREELVQNLYSFLCSSPSPETLCFMISFVKYNISNPFPEQYSFSNDPHCPYPRPAFLHRVFALHEPAARIRRILIEQPCVLPLDPHEITDPAAACLAAR